jgi:hypothetical protein
LRSCSAHRARAYSRNSSFKRPRRSRDPVDEPLEGQSILPRQASGGLLTRGPGRSSRAAYRQEKPDASSRKIPHAPRGRFLTRAARRPPRSQPPAPRQKASAAPGGRLWIAGVTRPRALTHKARRSNLSLAFLNFPAQETRSEARNPRSHRPGVSIRFWHPSRHRSPQTPANPRRHPKSTASCRSERAASIAAGRAAIG